MGTSTSSGAAASSQEVDVNQVITARTVSEVTPPGGQHSVNLRTGSQHGHTDFEEAEQQLLQRQLQQLLQQEVEFSPEDEPFPFDEMGL